MRTSIFSCFLFGIALVGALPTELSARCFIFVHGHQTHNLTYAEARDYWRTSAFDTINTDMAGDIGANNHYYVVNWNSTDYYWNGSVEVAEKINNALGGNPDPGGNSCAGDLSSPIVVAHSMGNAVMDFILGNARTTDPYYNYHSADFANIGAKLGGVVGVEGVHRGTYGADGLCGNASWFTNTVSGVVAHFTGATCDNGSASCQTADSWTVKTYANSPYKNVNLIAGYKGHIATSAILAGEDDMLVAYSSGFACSGSATASYTTSNVCYNNAKQEVSGFKNCDQMYENHDAGRNGMSQNKRKAVLGGAGVSGCWPSSYSTGTQVRSSMSTAELIRCVWATKPAGDTSCN